MSNILATALQSPIETYTTRTMDDEFSILDFSSSFVAINRLEMLKKLQLKKREKHIYLSTFSKTVRSIMNSLHLETG